MFHLVLAYLGSPGQKAVKWLCVCVCYLLGVTTLDSYTMSVCNLPTSSTQPYIPIRSLIRAVPTSYAEVKEGMSPCWVAGDTV